MSERSMTYKDAGVNYDAMDPFKRMAQLAARETADNIRRLNNGEFQELEMSRGESVYLIEAAKSYFAHVEEGLGTKNLVADAMYGLTGKSYYDCIAQDIAAMIVNDMITLGALPLSVAMHLAVSDSKWFDDEKRCRDLVYGWRNACNLARCTWGGGETPTLKGVVVPEAVVLSGSAMGLVKPKERLITGKNIQHGDAIVFIESSGIHANGLTLARKIAEKLARPFDPWWRKLVRFFFKDVPVSRKALGKAYLTKLSDGRTYGEALLNPTHIYVGLVEDCLDAGVDIHYAVNITGHGWRKLMRAVEPFVYIIDNPGEPQLLFRFIQEHGPVSDEETYGNFNMGVGFALYVPQHEVERVIRIAAQNDIRAWAGGHIEKRGNQKKVVIPSKSIEFAADSLAVR